MNIEDLMEQFICERIQVLMTRYLKEGSEARADQEDDVDSVLNGFSPEVRAEVEHLMEQQLCREAEKERMLYVSGVKDGFNITKRLVM